MPICMRCGQEIDGIEKSNSVFFCAECGQPLPDIPKYRRTFRQFLIVAFTAALCVAPLGATDGAIWSAALSRPVDSGALWGCLGIAIYALLISPSYAYNPSQTYGFFQVTLPLSILAGIIGLIVWLV